MMKVVIIHDFDNSVTPFLDRHLPMICKQHILDGNVRVIKFALSLFCQAKKEDGCCSGKN
jgi:hypothetical protein